MGTSISGDSMTGAQRAEYAAPTDADWEVAGRILREDFGLRYKIAEALAAERAKAEGKEPCTSHG